MLQDLGWTMRKLRISYGSGASMTLNLSFSPKADQLKIR